jgi:hypothetical protein
VGGRGGCGDLVWILICDLVYTEGYNSGELIVVLYESVCILRNNQCTDSPLNSWAYTAIAFFPLRICQAFRDAGSLSM